MHSKNILWEEVFPAFLTTLAQNRPLNIIRKYNPLGCPAEAIGLRFRILTHSVRTSLLLICVWINVLFKEMPSLHRTQMYSYETNPLT